jgi:L-asparaginase II
MELLGSRVLAKTGAEGVFCGALPDQGLGFAVKCDDGAGRAAEVITAALVARFSRLGDADRAALDELVNPKLRNWNGITVGQLRPTAALLKP